MELPHKNRTEFVESVQLHCKAVMERVRAVKESLNLPETSQHSQRPSDGERIRYFSPEPTEGTKKKSSGLDVQDQGQKIREHVERIIDLVRSGKKVQFSDMRLGALEKPSYRVATNDAGKEPRQDTSPAVEEKTLYREKTIENSVLRGPFCGSVEDTKLASAHSVLDGEALMELSSEDTCLKVPSLKECGDGRTHSASSHGRESHETDQIHSALCSKDRKQLVKDISGERQAASTISKIKKDISSPIDMENQLTERNSTYDTLLDISFENMDSFSSPPNQAHPRKPNGDNVVSTSSYPIMPWSRRVEDPSWQMAVKIVRNVYARIGCHENYLRYASWADEPISNTVELDSTTMPCNRSVSHEKIATPKGNDNDLENIDELNISGMASTALESTHSNTEEPGKETFVIQTDQLEVASTNSSWDDQRNPKIPVKGASLKHGQKKWAALKKRRKSFAFRRMESGLTNGTWKSLTLGKKTAEVAGHSCSEEGCSLENGENQPQKVRRQAAGGERLTPLKEFISLKDSKTRDGEDIIVVNPSKIPSKRDFTGRKEYNEIMARLLLFVQEFTDERVKSEKFVVAVHAVTQRSRLRSRKWATEFYKLLKNRYQNRLACCVFFKPSFKLRALVILSRPFVANDMREKIFIVKRKRKFSKA